MAIGIIIDTSRETSLLALIQGTQILFWEERPHEGRLSKYYLNSLEVLLQERGIPCYVAVGIGPGTFTGTRIGVAIAKSLSFGWQTPLVSFTSPIAFEKNARLILPQFVSEKFSAADYSWKGEVSLIY